MTFIIDVSELETFEECLNSPDSRNTPLSPADYCELKRAQAPHLQWDWGRPGVSLGPPIGNGPFEGIQIFAQPGGPLPPVPAEAPLPPTARDDAMTPESLPGFAGWNIPGKEFLQFIGGVLTKVLADPIFDTDILFEEPQEDDVAWIDDLGQLVGIAAPFLGGSTPAPQVYTTGYDPSEPVLANGGTSGPGAPVTFANCAPGASPVWKKVCGEYKWVTPKRRRRRQLLTNRDYDDLLKLQTIKVNANMTAAISKALTR